MKVLKFKTNINCNGCIASVTPFLNNVESIDAWKVDINNMDKILEVESDDGNVEDVTSAVIEAGYEIVKIE